MKFKRNFMIFALFRALAVCILSDILLISLFREITFDTERTAPLFAMIAVPLAFAAACRALSEVSDRFLVRRLRRRWQTIDGVGEYAFFRNYVLVLAAGAIFNTILLYDRYRSVSELLLGDEDRRLRMLFSDKPDYLVQRLGALADRKAFCDNAALIITVVLCIVKAAAYLFMARALVRTYHKNAVTAYAQEVHQ